MRRCGPAIVVVAAAMLALMPACHAGYLEGAAGLGDQKLTVHVDGSLMEALGKLSQMTKLELWLDDGSEPGWPLRPGMPLPAKPAPSKAAVPVKLDFDNAPLTEILSSVCKQTGLIADVLGARAIRFHPGDPCVDPRPAVDLGDYVLRIVDIGLLRQRKYWLDRGTPLPAEPTATGELELSLSIASKSPQAELKLAGIGREATATTDKGGALKTERDAAPERPDDPMDRIVWHDDRHAWPKEPDSVPSLRLPDPSPAVKSLTRVEGTLYLYSVVKAVEVKLRAADKGKPVKQGDVVATISSWKADVEHDLVDSPIVRVEVDVDAPPLVAGAATGGPRGGILVVGALVGKDGTRRAGDLGRGVLFGFGGDARHHSMVFYPNMVDMSTGPPGPQPAKFELDYLLLTVTRYGPADRKVPFVFENVPVP